MPTNARRFFIETFGCQMNEHDSEKISGLLARQGLVEAVSPDQANLFILNTCSVREKAAQKVYSRLGEIKRRKQEDSRFVIGVVGCVAQQEGEEMVKRAPYVDWVVGTHMYHAIPDLLEEIDAARVGARPHRVLTKFLKDPAPVELEAVSRHNAFRANITIMEGCNKRCSFCVVPFTRGKERNRPAAAILDEARRALDQGYVEILLLGQTVNSYRDPIDRRFHFADLLDQLSNLKGLRRLRFTSPHPRDFDDATISVIAANPVVCDQVHLPLQSGSNPILRRMRRQYSREWFLELVAKFEAGARSIRFSTDVIVGFPGETEEDFEQTLEIVRQVRFESMFSFKYSPRPYTEAQAWKDDVAEADKSRRLMVLQRLQREIQLELHRLRYLGRQVEVLVEGQARDGVNCFGRTTTNKIVNFPGDHRPGSFVQVEITQAGPNSFAGRASAPAPA